MWTQLYLISIDLRALLPFSWSGTRLKVEVILPIRRKLNEYEIVEECIRSIHIMAAKGLGIRSNADISPKQRGILKLVHFSHCTPARCSLLWKVRRANGAALSLTGQVGSYGLSSKWLGFGLLSAWTPNQHVNFCIDRCNARCKRVIGFLHLLLRWPWPCLLSCK